MFQKEPIDSETISQLKPFFENDIQKLQKLTKKNLKKWM